MQWQDLSVLADLEQELFPGEAWTEATWWAELALRPRREYVVLADEGPEGKPLGEAQAPGGIIGYAGLDHAGEVSDIMTIAVHPALQGRGAGRTLLGTLQSRARVRGAHWLMLEVRADNQAALAAYTSAGFTVLRTRKGYYRCSEGAIDALVMRKEVGDE